MGEGLPRDALPADTAGVSLPADVQKLIATLAKNTHAVWMQRRMADGWRYGPRRDDAAKEHPCLVPYEQLGEPDREYDRIVVSEVLKLLYVLGYRLERP